MENACDAMGRYCYLLKASEGKKVNESDEIARFT